MKTLRTTVYAPAKLNLLLAVGDKRPDGFHEVSTILQTIDLADRIDIDIEQGDTKYADILVEAPGVTGGDTLVTEAVTKFLELAKINTRIWITIEKEIPIGAGLGGGSSDAGTVLRALYDILQPDFSMQDLHKLASEIGSDVPFFLLGNSVAAYATGKGNILTLMDPLPSQNFLLAFPRVMQSTKEVYKSYIPSSANKLPTSIEEARDLALTRIKRNDLTDSARKSCEKMDKIYTAFQDAGGNPFVCGSGATVAVAFDSKEERLAFEAVAKNAVTNCWLRVVSSNTL